MEEYGSEVTEEVVYLEESCLACLDLSKVG